MSRRAPFVGSLSAALALACTPPSAADDAGAPNDDAGITTFAQCPDAEPVAVSAGTQNVRVRVDAATPCRLTLSSGGVVLEVHASADVVMTFDGDGPTEPGWFGPRAVTPGLHELRVSSDQSAQVDFEITDHGAPAVQIERDRSLVFTNPTLVDDPSVVSLGGILAAISEDGHGGRLLQAWLARFNTTAHSERAGPAQLLEEIETQQGADPTVWVLDALPFVVTAVHNRLDLKSDAHCGELRVSMASTHATLAPFHILFLFEQPAQVGDRSPAGVLHCSATARRWASLSGLSDLEFLADARLLLAEGLTKEKFALAESVEFMIAPWEWRQWVLVDSDDAQLPRAFDNPPLFQTLDIEGLNVAGQRRDDFLAFVEDNAAELNARTMLIPEDFRAPSTRVNAGVPWTPLDLDGVDPVVLEAFADLRGNLEIIGCHACHATDAEFVQTTPERTFSPFYDKELDARAVWLDALHRGDERPVPFGPLQEDPLLPTP